MPNNQQNNDDAFLANCLRLIFRLRVDRVKISWNPFVAMNSNRSSNDDNVAEEFYLRPTFLSSSSSEDDGHDPRENPSTIMTDQIETIQCECANRKHFDIDFHRQEIRIRSAIHYDHPQSMNIVRFDNRRRICRLTLIHSNRQRPRSQQRSSMLLLQKILTTLATKENNSNEMIIGFVDLDLAEMFCHDHCHKQTRTISMMMTDLHRKFIHLDSQHFCFELSLTIDCQPVKQSFRHYVGLKRFNSLQFGNHHHHHHHCNRRSSTTQTDDIISDQLRRNLSKQMDFSPANQRKHSLLFFDQPPTNKDDHRELTTMMTWWFTITNPLNNKHPWSSKMLYRIAIHFGQIEYLKTAATTTTTSSSSSTTNGGLVWACFQVKHHHDHHHRIQKPKSSWQTKIRTPQIYCRTKSQPFQTSNNDDYNPVNLPTFDESFVFFGNYDLTESGCLSLMMADDNDLQSNQTMMVFKCPLRDYLQQPSVNQYFYLEPSKHNRRQSMSNHQSSSSYCTLQFSICVEPLL